jgi:putative transposase
MGRTSYHAVHLHLVFSTNRRRRCIRGNVKSYLYEAIRSLITDAGGELRAIGGTTDHVHMLISVPPVTDISKLVQKIKMMTSTWLNVHYFSDDKFRWAKGYAVFSVSQSLIGKTTRYIGNQWEIHKQSTFREELEKILKVHNMELEVWEGPGEKGKEKEKVEVEKG